MDVGRPEPATERGVPAPVRLSSLGVSLRPIEPQDVAYLFSVETTAESSANWRFEGRTVSPEEFQRGLWDDVYSQYLIIRLGDGAGTPIGRVACRTIDWQNGVGSVVAIRFNPHPVDLGTWDEGVELFVRALFASTPVR